MSKYHASPMVIDGIRFASKAEGRRYAELKLLEKAGEITHLELQPEYALAVNGVLICKYRADFRYTWTHSQLQTVEDTKGFRTREFALKAKLMKAIHGIVIAETR